MKLLSRKCVLRLCGYISFSLLFPAFVAIHRSNSILIENSHIDHNGEVQETSVWNNGNKREQVNDVMDESSEDHLTTNTASEKFLESLREQCKKHKSITLICNSLRVVLPIAPPQPTPQLAASEHIGQITHINRQSLAGHTKLQKYFTDPSQSIYRGTHIANHKGYDGNTVLPTDNRHNFYHNHRNSSDMTDGDKVYVVIPRESYEGSGLTPMLRHLDGNNNNKPDVYTTDDLEDDVFRKTDTSDEAVHSKFIDAKAENQNYLKSGILRNVAYQNHVMTDISEDNVFRRNDMSEETASSEFIDTNIEEQNNSNEPNMFPDLVYRNHMVTDNSEDNVFRKNDMSEETLYSEFMEANEFTTPYTDINPDHGEIGKRELDISFDIEDDDTRKLTLGGKDKLDCNDTVNCSAGGISTENASDVAAKEGVDWKSGNMVDRLIDDSVKIFKNSFTIKFPTFERATNKISEWFQSLFGRNSRDEGKTLHI